MITTVAGRSFSRIGIVTPGHVLRSEWTKLRSLRSTYWSLLVAVVALAGLGVLFAAILMADWSSLAVETPPAAGRGARRTSRRSTPPSAATTSRSSPIGVLGVLVMSGEYSTGMIRSSLMAVPQRLPVLWAKLAVFCGVTFALMLWCALVGVLRRAGDRRRHGVDQSLGDPDALRVVVGTALYLTVIGALGVGLGALLRNTAAAISAFVALLFVLPAITALLPADLGASIGPYLPLHAGSAIATAQFGGRDRWLRGRASASCAPTPRSSSGSPRGGWRATTRESVRDGRAAGPISTRRFTTRGSPTLCGGAPRGPVAKGDSRARATRSGQAP